MDVIDPIPAQASPPQARPTRAEVQAQARRSHRKEAEAQSQGQQTDLKGARRSAIVLSILLVVLVGLLLAYVSLSDSVDYVHGFGRACLIAHDGWHFHLRCGSVSPPGP